MEGHRVFALPRDVSLRRVSFDRVQVFVGLSTKWSIDEKKKQIVQVCLVQTVRVQIFQLEQSYGSPYLEEWTVHGLGYGSIGFRHMLEGENVQVLREDLFLVLG